MRRTDLEYYRHPESGAKLQLEAIRERGGEVVEGALYCAESRSRFSITDGIPDLLYPAELSAEEREAQRVYRDVAEVYDKYMPLTFSTFDTDEWVERGHMVDLLRIEAGQTVLEIGAGTGRSSQLIADRLGPMGMFFVQDISRPILEKARERLIARSGPMPAVKYSLASGCYLPFPDNSFDACFHFGGLNMFPDIRRAFSDIVRVTRTGGRVVIGDESMPPWLRDTKVGKILMNSNPHYVHPVPLDQMPIEARNVRLEWIIGGVFYLISFDVGDGEPYADLDFEIPGKRGGTHRTRYYGQLEGVTPEAKKLAEQARDVTGKSMHQWLDEVVRTAAARDLGEGSGHE